MTWNTLDDKQKIAEIIDHLISRRAELKVIVDVEESEFTSKIKRLDRGALGSKIGKKPQLIIEKLAPEWGNTLIQSSRNLVLEFSINNNLFRCSVSFIGISSEYSYLSFALTFPDFIEIKEKRREEKFSYDVADFVSIEFILAKGTRRRKLYYLNVIDRRMHGLGVLIPKKHLDLVLTLQPGDKLKDMAVYAESSMIKLDGIVRHLTKIMSGRYKGSYLLGIEFPHMVL